MYNSYALCRTFTFLGLRETATFQTQEREDIDKQKGLIIQLLITKKS